MHDPATPGEHTAGNNRLKIMKFVAAAIGWLLIGGAIITCLFLKTIDDAYGIGDVVFRYILLGFVVGFSLWRWSDNDFKMEFESIPPLFRVSGLFLFVVFLLWLNLEICKYRLGVPYMSFMFLSTILLHFLAFLIGGLIIFASHGIFGDNPASPLRSLAGVTLSLLAFWALNQVFHSNIGDLTTDMKPTKTCYPGGTCYDSGMSAWGGYGATFLMLVNFMQGVLAFNILYGLFLLGRRIASTDKTAEDRG